MDMFRYARCQELREPSLPQATRRPQEMSPTLSTIFLNGSVPKACPVAGTPCSQAPLSNLQLE